jgi:hypothetical protein
LTTFGQRQWIVALFLPFFGALPAYSISQKVVGRKLESLGIEINGEDRKVKPQEPLSLIRGDEIVVHYAILTGVGESPSLIDFVGFPSGRSPSRDDRNRVIDTGRLRREKGRPLTRFHIRAVSGREEHGSMDVLVREPELVEMILKVNGTPRPVLAGQILSLKASDSLEVDSVRTNIPQVDKELRVSMDPVSSPLSGIQIKLFYRTYAFASVKVLLHPGSE